MDDLEAFQPKPFQHSVLCAVGGFHPAALPSSQNVPLYSLVPDRRKMRAVGQPPKEMWGTLSGAPLALPEARTHQFVLLHTLYSSRWLCLSSKLPVLPALPLALAVNGSEHLGDAGWDGQGGWGRRMLCVC